VGGEPQTGDEKPATATRVSGDARSGALPTWSHPREALGLFLAGATVRTAWKVAAVVGTVLSVVNQGSVITDGDATLATWIRVGVNYLVPFLVSSVGFLSACRHRREET
jgi:hypothetical protein